MSCSCCGMACIEIKCTYSINYTEPNKQNLDYLYKDRDAVIFKACVYYFLSNLYISPNDSPSKAMKNVFYFI